MNNDFVLFWNQESASMIYWCAKQLCWVAARLDQKCSSLNDMQSEGRTGGTPQADLPFMLWQGTAVPVSLVQLLLQARWSWRSDLPKGTKAAGKRAMARMAVPSAAHSPGSSHSQWDRSPPRWMVLLAEVTWEPGCSLLPLGCAASASQRLTCSANPKPCYALWEPLSFPACRAAACQTTTLCLTAFL